MNILTRFLAAQPLPGWLKPNRRPTAGAAPARRAPLPTLLEDQAPPRTCGCFDSSHELHSGLLVVEHSTADRLALGCPVAEAAPGAANRGLSVRAVRRGWRANRRKELVPDALAASLVNFQPDSATGGH